MVKRIRFRIAKVKQILISASKATEAGNEIRLTREGGEVIDKKGKKVKLPKKNGVYVLEAWTEVPEGFKRQVP